MSNCALRMMPLVLVTGLLIGCGTKVSNTACPPLRAYTEEFSNRVADEVESLPEGHPLVIVTGDYRTLREQLRACQVE